MKQGEQQVYQTFFLFINDGSGGNLGKQMLEDQVEKYQFRFPIEDLEDIHTIDVYMYSLKSNRERGMKRLKSLNQEGKRCVVIICGGDGSIMWVLSQFHEYKIQPMLAPIAIIPLGTGNDFSRSLGWGGTPFLRWGTKQLKQLVRNWIEAEEDYFDLWEVSVSVYENGFFEKVVDQKDTILTDKIIKKNFCNYFSFGIDGQIGYTFDKHRTTSKFANLAVYGAVGAFNQLQKPVTINTLVQSLYQCHAPENQQKLREHGRMIFYTQDKKIHLCDKLTGEEAVIKDGQRNILALNIDSYTGGTTGIWKNSKDMLNSEVVPASASDGRLQIVCFDSGLGIAMQKSIGGFAKKIVQSEGPLRFDFRKQTKSGHCTYAQIDGQFYRVNHPESVIIRRSNLLGGVIKVLRRNTKKQVFNPFKDLQDLFL